MKGLLEDYIKAGSRTKSLRFVVQYKGLKLVLLCKLGHLSKIQGVAKSKSSGSKLVLFVFKRPSLCGACVCE